MNLQIYYSFLRGRKVWILLGAFLMVFLWVSKKEREQRDLESQRIAAALNAILQYGRNSPDPMLEQIRSYRGNQQPQFVPTPAYQQYQPRGTHYFDANGRYVGSSQQW